MATIGQQLLQPENGWRRIDNTHSGFLYSNSSWTHRTGGSGYNGTDSYTSTLNSTITFKVRSKNIRIISVTSTSMASNIKITINDTDVYTISEYSSNTIWQSLVFEKSLGDGFNKVVIENLGGGGSVIGLDAIDIDLDGELDVKVGQQLLAPEGSWRRYDNSHQFIKYVGTWVHRTNVTIKPQYNNTDSYSLVVGDYIQFNFKGTRLRLISFIGNAYSNDITITIDGIDENINTYDSNPYTNQVLIYEKLGLSNDIHSIRLTLNNATYGGLTIDAIDIDADGELIRHDYFENEHLPDDIRKYGMVWFDFDEAGGNALDKLGGYVGTIHGNPTRATGWNGKGNAISFNGVNQYIKTNFIPTATDLTIKLKMKVKGYNGTFFSTQGWNNTSNGIDVYIRDNSDVVNYGKTMLRMNNGATNVLTQFSSTRIELNKWTDVMISFDFTNGYITQYINEELSVRSKINTRVVGYSYALAIGRLENVNSSYFNGEIDDYIIYSGVLSPQSMTKEAVQKSLLIKNNDSLQITLSPDSNRIKEIPNYNYAYRIKEIDGASDGSLYDLSKASSEYEMISSNKNVLNGGVQFTIPIVKSFKTIKIENNH